MLIVTGTFIISLAFLIAPVGATCGGGNIGNGICADGLCCSQWGWCGTSVDHCGGPPPAPTTPSPTAAPVPTPPVTPVSARDDSRLIAYMGNWQACPTADMFDAYTHVMIAFAVSYVWSPGQNQCDTQCTIATPPVCNNGPNQQLIDDLHAAGKKVLLSFGGAGMGGSWDGNNRCWDHCFSRTNYVVDRLTEIVNTMDLDGVDIDYEYFYEDNPGFNWYKGEEAQDFLIDVTVGLRNNLPGAEIIHVPMEPDIIPGKAYHDVVLPAIAPYIDYLMPQYYNGYVNPITNGFTGGNGFANARTHYENLVDNLFNGDATKVVFGFCITQCGSFNSNGNQAAAVMAEISLYHSCNGGAFFWVSADDNGGSWSDEVSAVTQTNAGCSENPTPPVTPAPVVTTAAPVTPAPVITTGAPVTPAPVVTTAAPVTPAPVVTTAAPATPAPVSSDRCCAAGYTGLNAYNGCTQYYHCVNGVVTGPSYSCAGGTGFHQSLQICNWLLVFECEIPSCGGGPPPTTVSTPPPTVSTLPPTVSTPPPSVLVTPPPTQSTNAPTGSPTSSLATEQPTPVPTTGPPTIAPVPPPTIAPVPPPVSSGPCCPAAYTGLRSYNDCTQYYHCVNGVVTGPLYSCAGGTGFQQSIQNCNWLWAFTCEAPPSC